MSRAYIVVEAPTDATLLKELLPSSLLQEVKFINGEGKHSATSMARKLLMTEHIPTVLVIDADTDRDALVHQQQQDLDYLLHQAADGTPCKLLMAVPDLDSIFLQDRQLLEQLLEMPLSDLEWQLAQQQPGQLLNTVSGGRQSLLEKATRLLNLNADNPLRQHPLVQELIQFLASTATASVETYAN